MDLTREVGVDELEAWRAWAREVLGDNTVDVFGDHAARVDIAVLIPGVDEDTGECCPGKGRCHGPLSWCTHCGDVGDVCDAPPGHCDCHPDEDEEG